jgi:hypothetical protein
VLAQVALHVEDAVLAVADDGQTGRVGECNLATQLAADRAARAGDEDTLAREVQAGSRTGNDLIPPQQVGNVDLS